MKTTLLTVDGASELRFAFTARQSRCEKKLITGMAIIVLASYDNLERYLFVISTKPKHHQLQSTSIYIGL